jgi:hypothetical protein
MFGLVEDGALKAKLQGITVDDVNAPAGGRRVDVKFASPEMELSKLTYPCILITAQQMERASDREHRGHAALTYYPEGNPSGDSARLDPTNAPKVEFPVPMDVVYQIVVAARRHSHRTQIVNTLAGQDYLPQRFGFLTVDNDFTVRSLFLDGGPEFSNAATDEDGKRLLSAHYVVRIPTEIPPEIASAAPVTDVAIDAALM